MQSLRRPLLQGLFSCTWISGRALVDQLAAGSGRCFQHDQVFTAGCLDDIRNCGHGHGDHGFDKAACHHHLADTSSDFVSVERFVFGDADPVLERCSAGLEDLFACDFIHQVVVAADKVLFAFQKTRSKQSVVVQLSDQHFGEVGIGFAQFVDFVDQGMTRI